MDRSPRVGDTTPGKCKNRSRSTRDDNHISTGKADKKFKGQKTKAHYLQPVNARELVQDIIARRLEFEKEKDHKEGESGEREIDI